MIDQDAREYRLALEEIRDFVTAEWAKPAICREQHVSAGAIRALLNRIDIALQARWTSPQLDPPVPVAPLEILTTSLQQVGSGATVMLRAREALSPAGMALLSDALERVWDVCGVRFIVSNAQETE